jgi:histidine ammonia-lyase
MSGDAANDSLVITGTRLTCDDVARVARGGCQVVLDRQARDRIAKCREWVDGKARDGEVIYGVTTGFGSLADVAIRPDQAAELSLNLIRSHAVGVGAPLAEDVVRAAMLIRANTLAKGFSGARAEVVETLLAMLNKGVHPVIPEKGSVGASGDLAPLSHMALVLVGEGEAILRGKRLAGGEALRQAGIPPLILGPKEGLALSNGTTVSGAMAVLCLVDAENLLKNAQIALALSLEALQAAPGAFSPLVHAARNQAGQQKVAENVRALLEGSQLVGSRRDKVQDAYSLRCAPQVLGPVLDLMAYLAGVVESEINAATDNPLVFPDQGAILSGGNFHGEPLAFAMDFLRIAVAEAGSIAERRVFRMLDASLSGGLPPFLVEGSGLNNGLMTLQYTAAALVSANKTLCHPDSVDSVPTCANQEDHVSMSCNAALHAREVLANVEQIVAIEMLCAAQALDFRVKGAHFRETRRFRAGAKAEVVLKIQGENERTYSMSGEPGDQVTVSGRFTGPPRRPAGAVSAAYNRIRADGGSAFVASDRPLAEDIAAISAMVHNATIVRAVEAALGRALSLK